MALIIIGWVFPYTAEFKNYINDVPYPMEKLGFGQDIVNLWKENEISKLSSIAMRVAPEQR